MAVFPFALLMLLQAASATAPQATILVEDARRLTAAATNEARFEALTALLRSRGLAFTVEPFTIEKPVGGELPIVPQRRLSRRVIAVIQPSPKSVSSPRFQSGTRTRVVFNRSTAREVRTCP